MTDNPAITLHNAWDGMMQLNIQPHQREYLGEQLPAVDTSDRGYLDQVPYSSDRSLYGLQQMVNWNTAYKPTGMLPDGRLFYTLGFTRGGSFEPLFQIAPDGEFRLGTTFYRWTTRGSYERVEQHTFLGAQRAYDHTYKDWVWWVQGYNDRIRWFQTRDWRRHAYYCRTRTFESGTWLKLVQVGGTWRIDIAPNQDQARYDSAKARLKSNHESVEAYYAKWRRRYHREHNLPDPEKALDASDIETVDYIAQHLNVYEPPKARMPS